ncbi:P-loop containing nucleoside triphosphate hydrolase protein [Boeremia exigua]|uniref:P-loop containing nucleoside triphosphate hydrolase protein n=1 Tax=Boeremia exigua TaxID=749465 RepID=UPI001E8D2478|nr:P-loop containing nucleoside triphosphate hydrolase protein [Boeremia exigua]KAH6639568.1 P-loop containing nucleoside triphosphate hydrolase protein [Boeremia exigua]
MSFSHSKASKDYHRALQSFAESGAVSDEESDDGLDIVESSRKQLDLSQYIGALTQTQTQSQDGETMKACKAADEESDGDEAFETALKLPESQATESETDDDDPGVESEWSEEDTRAAYEKWKNRKTLKRKRAVAETVRIRQQKKSKAAATTSIVGRKPPPKAKQQDARDVAFSTDSVAGDAEDATYLDDPIPEYITSRQKHLKKLHEAGLRYPPSFENIEFSDSETEEKPQLDKAVKPQRGKKKLRLRESGGIIPAPIAQWLRDYQVEGVEFLHERFVRQTGAILGDDMGLGKTIQVIAFLTAAFGKTATKTDAKCMRKIRRDGEDRWYPRVLVVCPGTLMQNWEDELSKWGWWEVYRYHGNVADRKGVLSAAKRGMLEIMITTYNTYRINESDVNTIDWDCVIADECHSIKSKSSEITIAMNRINALCRIGLTGTAIQNKYEELWNLLNWARPGAYGSAQEWKQTISVPLKMGQAHDATNAQLADSRSRAQDLVHNILPNVFLRRMKTLIADQLPKKSDRVVFCQLTETQADAYRTYLESDRCEYIRTAKEPCDCQSGKPRGWCCYTDIPGIEEKWAKFMFPCMVTLQKLANHIALIVPSSTDTKEKQAKDLQNLETACPDTYRELWRNRDAILNQSQREFCGKWKVLRRLLDFWHSNGDKVLIFSHSVRLLRLLRGLFDVDGTKYNFSYLDGSMKYEDRSKAVADFNADPEQFVFLISTKAGGVGLNITSANKVVVVDPNWNPAYDLQAQDRAYRIGQTRDVEVFRLVSSGTIEEIVYARQIYKQQQANIGYNASEERRYFKGVMDQASKKGELFGLENLFTFQENSVLLRDIMHKTNVAESRAGVQAVDFQFDETQYSSDDDEDILSNRNLGIDDSNLANIKKLAESLSNPGSDVKRRGRKKYQKKLGADPISAILAKAGVQYTHENSEVIGRSEVEARLGKQAMELRNDIDLSAAQVFQATQSQRGSNTHAHPLAFEEDAEVDEDDEIILPGGAQKREFKINYRYRPDEQVRQRQFCAMAESMGFEDPAEFALLVESSTQAERRKMLERFYRGRRKGLAKELGS